MLYKLTRGAVSVIRTNEEDVRQAIEYGYVLDGSVDEAYNVIDSNPFRVKPKRDDVPTVDSVSRRHK